MAESSKVTNILLAIIAVCLVVIALKPAGLIPEAAAQRDRDASRDRFSSITATTDKAAAEQVAAVESVARAIENLAKATGDIAKAIEIAGERARSGAAAGGTPPRSSSTPIVIR